MLDPRGMVTKMRAADDDEGAQGPAEAPTTIMLGEAIEPGQKESFGYRPDLGEVPLISLPDTLPDLAGIITCIANARLFFRHITVSHLQAI